MSGVTALSKWDVDAKKRELRLLNHYAFIINIFSKALNIYTRE